MAAPRKENVKDIIIESTESLLKTHSIDDISLAEISTAAGISKGTLYYHYKTKEDILLDITDRYLEQQWNDLIVWTEDKSKDTSFHRLIKYVIERSASTPGPRMHLIYNACIGNETIQKLICERYQRFARIISEKISERLSGEFSEYSDYLAWLMLIISDGLIIQSEIKNPLINTADFIKQTDKFSELLQK